MLEKSRAARAKTRGSGRSTLVSNGHKAPSKCNVAIISRSRTCFKLSHSIPRDGNQHTYRLKIIRGISYLTFLLGAVGKKLVIGCCSCAPWNFATAIRYNFNFGLSLASGIVVTLILPEPPMKTLRFLLVEDEPLDAMELQQTITKIVPAMLVKRSVAEALSVLSEPFDIAFLVVDRIDEKAYFVAQALSEKLIPFAFVSGSDRNDLPAELQSIPFIAKPFDRGVVAGLLWGTEN